MKIQTYKLIPIIAGILLVSTLYLVLAQDPITLTTSATLEISNNALNYDFDWGSTSITLYKDNNVFADIYTENKADGSGWKFGATDNLRGGEAATYKYVLSSTDNLVLLEKNKYDEKGNFTYNYPIVYNYHSGKDEWNEYRHIYSFEDVCSKDYAGCEWTFNNNVLELSFISDGNIDPGIENVSSCRTLDTENQYYQLNKSITATGDCIVINNKSITFDCNGYSITSSYNVSGVYSTKLNTTIKNCNISMGSGSGGYGIELSGGPVSDLDNAYIYNSTLSNQYNGIRMVGGFAVDYENLRVEKVTANSNADSGIYISPTKPLNNSVFKDIAANLNGNAGIYLASGSNNTFTNITANSNSVYGIDYSSGSYNTFSNITANSNVVGMSIVSSTDILTNLNLHSNEWGLSIVADFNNVSDSNISNSSTDDVWIGSSGNVFLNVSYDISKENVDSGSLIRKWYYQAYANDSIGPVDLVSDKVYNNTQDLEKQLITGNDSHAYFDGNGDYIGLGSGTSLDFLPGKNYTVSGWINSKSIANRQAVFDHQCVDDNIGLSIMINSQKLGIYSGAGAQIEVESSALSSNVWYYFAFVYNDSSANVYINGVPNGSGTFSVTAGSDASQPVFIGANAGGQPCYGAGYGFNGTIDNILFFNRSLNSTEIKELYELGRRDFIYTDDSLISAWRFDVNQTNAVDGIGSNNGTFQGNAGYGITEYSSGYTEEYFLIEYINNAGTRTYYNNYIVNAEKQCYPPYSLFHNLTSEQNILDLLILSNTLQNWPWNLQDGCTISNREFNVKNITTSNGGTWLINNVNLTVENFDINSTDEWQIEFMNVRMIGD